jgi:phosphatidylethanolamine-binding protein (PEBP) family uncharacterized protein
MSDEALVTSMSSGTENDIMCEVCDNPCEDTISISERSIDVEEYAWLCYDPDTASETAFLHE